MTVPAQPIKQMIAESILLRSSSFCGTQRRTSLITGGIDFLIAEIWDLLQKQMISVVQPHNRKQLVYSVHLLIPKKRGTFTPLLDLVWTHPLATNHFTCYQAAVGTGSAGVTSIDIKVATLRFSHRGGSETQKLYAFCFPGGSLGMQQLPISVLACSLHLQQLCGSSLVCA